MLKNSVGQLDTAAECSHN